MLHIHALREGLPLFKALGSETRVSILEMLYAEGPMRMSDISQRLGLTSGALTPHVKMLADCGLINITIGTGKHGVQKICSASEDRILIDPVQTHRGANVYETEIGVGQYTAHEALPTCGLATPEHVIGVEDDPRFFASPDRVNSGIVWLGSGYLEYMLPNFLKPNQKLVEIQISLEISSEAPGFSEDWPSDISFYLNGVELCTWTSPADFGATRGIYTPKWWDRNWNQHGLFKLLSVSHSGTFIDGGKRSDVTLSDLPIENGVPLTLRIAAPKDARHAGGLTIYGRSFGNYEQDISVRMHYRESEAPPAAPPAPDESTPKEA